MTLRVDLSDLRAIMVDVMVVVRGMVEDRSARNEA